MNIEAKYLKKNYLNTYYSITNLTSSSIQSWEYSSKIENNSCLYYTASIKI